MFERLFPFFYTGKVELWEGEAVDMYKTTHLLEIKDLRNEIVKFLGTNLSPDLVARVFQMAIDFKLRKLKN